ncbi:hypothetical protein MHB44_17985 [Lysinibacillus sp. FSL H8-0500]|uniref:hypothetical protein n=1 Tax=Lysinibacillus sp. FSL H8-0500 TaxID=2921393 RepID=UPI0031011D2C
MIDGSSKIILSTGEAEENIGYIHFKIFNSRLLNKFQLVDIADAASSDEEWLISTFIELFEEELEEWSPKFLTLDKILLEPSYRNNGYGKNAIKELIKLCTILEIDYIILKPSPIEDVNFSDESKSKRKKDIERLVAFYDQLEFESYFIEGAEPMMVLDINKLT